MALNNEIFYYLIGSTFSYLESVWEHDTNHVPKNFDFFLFKINFFIYF